MQFMMHISSSPPSQFSDDHYAATSVRWGIQNWFMKYFRKNINCLLYAAMIFTFISPFLVEPFNGNEKINQRKNETINGRDVKMKKRWNDEITKQRIMFLKSHYNKYTFPIIIHMYLKQLHLENPKTIIIEFN